MVHRGVAASIRTPTAPSRSTASISSAAPRTRRASSFRRRTCRCPRGWPAIASSDAWPCSDEVDRQRAGLERLAANEQFDRYRQDAISLLADAAVHRALDVANADAAVLDRYGRNVFGWSLLMARRLVEAGVNLVQVNLGNNETWDTHQSMFPDLKEQAACRRPTGPCRRCSTICRSRGAARQHADRDGRRVRPHAEDLDAARHEAAGPRSLGRGADGLLRRRRRARRARWSARRTQRRSSGQQSRRPENMAATIYQALGIPATAAWHDVRGPAAPRLSRRPDPRLDVGGHPNSPDRHSAACGHRPPRQTGGNWGHFWCVRRLPTQRPRTGALTCDSFMSLLFVSLCRSRHGPTTAPTWSSPISKGTTTAAGAPKGRRSEKRRAHGTLANQMAVDGFLGHGLVNSYLGGDGPTGTLESPPFKIERPFINFLIGGGHHPSETCVDLLVDGRVVEQLYRPGGRRRKRASRLANLGRKRFGRPRGGDPNRRSAHRRLGTRATSIKSSKAIAARRPNPPVAT